MKLRQEICSIRGFQCSLEVNDNTEGGFSSFIKYYNGINVLKYSMYLRFSISLDADGKVKDYKDRTKSDGDIYESCVFSFFDMFKLKTVAKKLIEDLSSEYYTMEEHIEKGFIPVMKPEFKKYLQTLTNTTKTAQIGFKPKFLYNRKEDEYYPVIVIMINRDDVGVKIPLQSFLSIMQYLVDVDLHNSSTALINASLANRSLAKRNTNTSINNTTAE